MSRMISKELLLPNFSSKLTIKSCGWIIYDCEQIPHKVMVGELDDLLVDNDELGITNPINTELMFSSYDVDFFEIFGELGTLRRKFIIGW